MEAGITYHFSVEGCAEERFFELTLHSSCTSWSREEILTTIPSAIAQKDKELAQQFPERWGKPISLEEYDGDGWYHQDFDYATSIYWNKSVGTVVIYGFIAQEWRKQGGGASPVGYPIREEHDWPDHPGGHIACFQYGTITWYPQDEDHATLNAHAPCS